MSRGRSGWTRSSGRSPTSRRGKAVVVVDDEDRENEGDIVFAAAKATPELLAFTIRYTSGVVCVPMEGRDLDRLKLPPMTAVNEDRKRTAYAVSVDARDGIDTGISAADRARTIRVLVDSATEPYELTRPGHVFPLRAVDGGVLRRHRAHRGVGGPGPARRADARGRRRGGGQRRRLDVAAARAAPVRRRARPGPGVDRGPGHLPPPYRDARGAGRRGPAADPVRGVPGGRLPQHGRRASSTWPWCAARSATGTGVLVRLHSECLTGDVLGSLRCDCGPQLEAALRTVAEAGRGVVVYLRGHEGRGIGLLHKLAAYRLQDGGRDTVDANLDLGLPADARDFSVGAQILGDLGVTSVRLLTNNPAKRAGVEEHGLTVLEQVPLEVHVTPENIGYLRTKRDRMGHDLPGLDGSRQTRRER